MNNELKRRENDLNIAKTLSSAIERAIAEYPAPDTRPQDRVYIAWYRNMLHNIGTQIGDIKIRDIGVLDNIFRTIYVPLSLKLGIIPKIIDFCNMLNLNPDTIYSMCNNPNTPAYTIYSGWINICKQYVLANLTDEAGSNVNLIFVAKSTFGINDSPSANNTQNKRIMSRSRAEILAELGGETQYIVDKSEE